MTRAWIICMFSQWGFLHFIVTNSSETQNYAVFLQVSVVFCLFHGLDDSSASQCVKPVLSVPVLSVLMIWTIVSHTWWPNILSHTLLRSVVPHLYCASESPGSFREIEVALTVGIVTQDEQLKIWKSLRETMEEDLTESL